MTNLNSVLVAHITGSFGIASGIFFLLYCLEKPIYSQVLKKNAGAVDSDTQMRRVLVVLQQFLTFRVPFVMGILIIGAMLSCLLRLGLYLTFAGIFCSSDRALKQEFPQACFLFIGCH